MKVHIKRLLPPIGVLRNIIVRTNDGRKFKLGHMQEMEVEVEDGGWVSFRLDWYHRKVMLDQAEQGRDVYVILYYAMRQGFWGWIDSMGNMLRADVVDKAVYDNGEKWLLSQLPPNKKYRPIDYVLVSLLTLPFLMFLVYALLHPEMEGRDFTFFIAFLCTFGCLRLFAARNRIPEKNFNGGVYTSLVVSLLLLVYTAYPLPWVAAISSPMLAVLAILVYQRLHKPSKAVSA